jgi:hypothetical protein
VTARICAVGCDGENPEHTGYAAAGALAHGVSSARAGTLRAGWHHVCPVGSRECALRFSPQLSAAVARNAVVLDSKKHTRRVRMPPWRGGGGVGLLWKNEAFVSISAGSPGDCSHSQASKSIRTREKKEKKKYARFGIGSRSHVFVTADRACVCVSFGTSEDVLQALAAISMQGANQPLSLGPAHILRAASTTHQIRPSRRKKLDRQGPQYQAAVHLDAPQAMRNI